MEPADEPSFEILRLSKFVNFEAPGARWASVSRFGPDQLSFLPASFRRPQPPSDRRPDHLRSRQRLVRLGIHPDLFDAVAAPFDAAPDMGECALNELAHRVGFAGGKHVIVGLGLLQHQPHAFHIVARMAPIALSVEVAEKQLALQPMGDRGDTAPDLARDEGLAADRAYMS
jgi:hypothetical protein